MPPPTSFSARALARRPRILLLDEPASGLGPSESEAALATSTEVRAAYLGTLEVEPV